MSISTSISIFLPNCGMTISSPLTYSLFSMFVVIHRYPQLNVHRHLRLRIDDVLLHTHRLLHWDPHRHTQSHDHQHLHIHEVHRILHMHLYITLYSHVQLQHLHVCEFPYAYALPNHPAYRSAYSSSSLRTSASFAHSSSLQLQSHHGSCSRLERGTSVEVRIPQHQDS